MKEHDMRDLTERTLRAASFTGTTKSTDLIERTRAQLAHVGNLARQLQEEQVSTVRAKLDREDRLHAELVQKQQELIDTQIELLAEARKDKWKVTLLVGVLCVLLGYVLQLVFG